MVHFKSNLFYKSSWCIINFPFSTFSFAYIPWSFLLKSNLVLRLLLFQIILTTSVWLSPSSKKLRLIFPWMATLVWAWVWSGSSLHWAGLGNIIHPSSPDKSHNMVNHMKIKGSVPTTIYETDREIEIWLKN